MTSTRTSRGAAKKAGDPQPSPQFQVLERGPDRWSDARVDALISKGVIQEAWLPDIRATAPTHLQIQNQQQREMLRFSNAIANTGAATWQVRRGTPITDPAQIAYALSLNLDPSQLAITAQELLDARGKTSLR